MEVDATDRASDLVEADVVEALEASARYSAYTMVWHQEVLLPAHEDILALSKVLDVHDILPRLCILRQRSPRGEAAPVLHVHLVCRAPFRMLGLEAIFRADDLAFEVGGERGMVVRQPLNLKVAAQERLCHVHMLQLHFDLVHLPI